MKSNIFARAFFLIEHFAALLVLSQTWNDLFCIWEHFFKNFLLSRTRSYQFNSLMVGQLFWVHRNTRLHINRTCNIALSLSSSSVSSAVSSSASSSASLSWSWHSCGARRCCRHCCCSIREFKIWGQQRQRQRQKSIMSLVEWGKIIVLHVQHAF